MKSTKIGSKIYRLIKSGSYDRSEEKDIMVIRGERAERSGKKMISLEMSEEFISIWVGNHRRSNDSASMEINLYVFNRADGTLWIGGLIDTRNIIESKILFPKSVEYMCAMNSMKCFLGDLFLMRPHDMRVLEVMDLMWSNNPKSSVESFMKVLYKMISND